MGSPGIFLSYNSSLSLKVRKLCGFILKAAIACGLGAEKGCSWIKRMNPSHGFWAKNFRGKCLLSFALHKSGMECPTALCMFGPVHRAPHNYLLSSFRKHRYKVLPVKVTEPGETSCTQRRGYVETYFNSVFVRVRSWKNKQFLPYYLFPVDFISLHHISGLFPKNVASPNSLLNITNRYQKLCWHFWKFSKALLLLQLQKPQPSRSCEWLESQASSPTTT